MLDLPLSSPPLGVVISVGPTGDLNERGERRITIRGATQAHNDHAKGLIESRMAAYEPKHKPGDGAPGAPMLVLKLRVPDLTPEQKDALVAESQRFQLGKCKECNATLLESSMAEHVASECKMGDLDSGFDDRAQANKTRDQEKASQDRALAREQVSCFPPSPRNFFIFSLFRFLSSGFPVFLSFLVIFNFQLIRISFIRISCVPLFPRSF
jgi:hypothetical protein